MGRSGVLLAPSLEDGGSSTDQHEPWPRRGDGNCRDRPGGQAYAGNEARLGRPGDTGQAIRRESADRASVASIPRGRGGIGGCGVGRVDGGLRRLGVGDRRIVAQPRCARQEGGHLLARHQPVRAVGHARVAALGDPGIVDRVDVDVVDRVGFRSPKGLAASSDRGTSATTSARAASDRKRKDRRRARRLGEMAEIGASYVVFKSFPPVYHLQVGR